MQALYFLAAAVVLYAVSDWILKRIEAARQHPFENRSIVFFFILLGLGLITFPLLQQLLAR